MDLNLISLKKYQKVMETTGILGYGAYIPRKRINCESVVRRREGKRDDIAEFVKKIRDGLMLRYKSLPSYYEDTITIATEAAENAITMAQISPSEIEAVTVGSESKPYAVGTTARHVASFVGIGNNCYIADLEGACNSGMQGLEFIDSQIKSGKIKAGLAVGSDVAQAPMADPLEYAAGAGAGAFVLGKAEENELVATVEDTAAYSTLTMDFWRRDLEKVPKHFGKTTVVAYINHEIGAIESFLIKHPELSLKDFDYFTCHQPSGYLPRKLWKVLAGKDDEFKLDKIVEHKEVIQRMKLDEEFYEAKIKPWLRVIDTGNTYAASTPIAVCDILDHAKPGEDILAVSYGSGAYTIATWLNVKNGIENRKGKVPTVADYANRKVEVNFEDYQDYWNERIGLSKYKTKFGYKKIIGKIEALDSDFIEIALCNGCERIEFPARDKCIEYVCDGDIRKKKYPRLATLKTFQKPSLIYETSPSRSKRLLRLIPSFEIYNNGKVIIDDCEIEDLHPGMKLERVIRKLGEEGEAGLIIYGPVYRPLFRKDLESKVAA